MIAYNIFDGSSVQRQESPLEPGVWLMPAHATEKAPPEYNPSTETCRFNGFDWIVEEIPPVQESVETEETLDPWEELRFQRNNLLRESDWRMNSDYPYSDQELWIQYRIALRELPQNTTDPSNPSWPTAP